MGLAGAAAAALAPALGPDSLASSLSLPAGRWDDVAYLISEHGTQFLAAWGVALAIALVSFAGGLLLACLLTVARISPIEPARRAVDAYVEIFRNAPALTVLFFLYYGLPYLGIMAGEATVVVVALILISSAFACDNLRSGINSVEPGQIEAARALGLSFLDIVREVVLPQALRTVVAPMTTLLVMVIISSSVGALIPLGHRELTGLVNSINTSQALGIATFGVAALFYILTGVLVGWLGGRLERRVQLIR